MKPRLSTDWFCYQEMWKVLWRGRWYSTAVFTWRLWPGRSNVGQRRNCVHVGYCRWEGSKRVSIRVFPASFIPSAHGKVCLSWRAPGWSYPSRRFKSQKHPSTNHTVPKCLEAPIKRDMSDMKLQIDISYLIDYTYI
jgi:hypothetical protein